MGYLLAFIIPYIIIFLIREFIRDPFAERFHYETKSKILYRLDNIDRGDVRNRLLDKNHHNHPSNNQDMRFHLLDLNMTIEDIDYDKFEFQHSLFINSAEDLLKVRQTYATFVKGPHDKIKYKLFGHNYREGNYNHPYELYTYSLYDIKSRTISKHIDYQTKYPDNPLYYSAKTLHELNKSIRWVSRDEARWQSYEDLKQGKKIRLEGDIYKRYKLLFKTKRGLRLSYEPFWGYKNNQYKIIWDESPNVMNLNHQ